MKKRYLILAGLLVMTVAAAGCGKKKTTETAPVEVTATPTPEVTRQSIWWICSRQQMKT